MEDVALVVYNVWNVGNFGPGEGTRGNNCKACTYSNRVPIIVVVDSERLALYDSYLIGVIPIQTLNCRSEQSSIREIPSSR